MARQTINDELRSVVRTKLNRNFTELYGATEGFSTDLEAEAAARHTEIVTAATAEAEARQAADEALNRRIEAIGESEGGGTALTEISYADYITLRDGAGLGPNTEYLVYDVPDATFTETDPVFTAARPTLATKTEVSEVKNDAATKISFRDAYLSEPADLYLDTNFTEPLSEYYSSKNPYSTWADLIKDPRFTSNCVVHISAKSTITEDVNITNGSDGQPIHDLQILAEGSADAAWVEAHKLYIANTGEIRIKGLRFTKAVNIVNATGTVAIEHSHVGDYFNADIETDAGFISINNTTFTRDLTFTTSLTGDDKAYFYMQSCWGAAGSGFSDGHAPKVICNSPNVSVQMVGCTQLTPERMQGDFEATDCAFVGDYDTDGTTKLPAFHSYNTPGQVDLVRCWCIMPDKTKAPVKFDGTASLNISTTEFDWGNSTLAGHYRDYGLSSVQVMDRGVYQNYAPRLVNTQGMARTEPITLKDHLAGIDDKLGELSSGVKGAGVITFRAENWKSGEAYAAGTGVNYNGTRGYFCNTANSDTVFNPAKWDCDDQWFTLGRTYRAWTDFVSANGYAFFPETTQELTQAKYDEIYAASLAGAPVTDPGAVPDIPDSLGWHILPSSPGPGTYLVLWFVSNQAWINTSHLSQYTASNGAKLVGFDFQVDPADGDLALALALLQPKEAGKGLTEAELTTALKNKLSALYNQAELLAALAAKADDSVSVTDVAGEVTKFNTSSGSAVANWIKAMVKKVNGLIDNKQNNIAGTAGQYVKSSGTAGTAAYQTGIPAGDVTSGVLANDRLPVRITDVSYTTAGVLTVTMSRTPTSVAARNMQGTAIAGAWGAAGATMTFTPTVAGQITSSAFKVVVT